MWVEINTNYSSNYSSFVWYNSVHILFARVSKPRLHSIYKLFIVWHIYMMSPIILNALWNSQNKRNDNFEYWTEYTYQILFIRIQYNMHPIIHHSCIEHIHFSTILFSIHLIRTYLLVLQIAYSYTPSRAVETTDFYDKVCNTFQIEFQDGKEKWGVRSRQSTLSVML